jgi:D-alanine-D-alanine ligase
MSMATTVLMLMGGRSSEHEVSLSSARGVMGALDPDQFTIVPVVIETNGTWTRDGRRVTLSASGGQALLVDLEDGNSTAIDVVFPVLHGPFGEDGTIQGLCEMVGVPYVGAGVTASAIGMDKALFKLIARQHGLPVAAAVVVTPASWEVDRAALRAAVDRMGYPVFVKPARLGSSVGISRVADRDDLDQAVALALTFDEKVLIERAITGKEVEVGILDDGELIVSPPGQIRYAAEWYDYETKYEAGRAELEIPAELSDEITHRLQDVARVAFASVGCTGMGRIDCFVTPEGEVIVSELNTIPGFTPTSAYPSLMAAAGVPYPELVGRLVHAAVARAERERVLRR